MSRRSWPIECKVYVGDLDPKASEREVEEPFAKIGTLRNVWVARNPPGFAFVEFEDPRDASEACKNLDGTRIGNTRVRVEMSHGRSRREGGRGGGGGGGFRRDTRGRWSPPRRQWRSRSRSRDRDRERERYRSRSRSRDAGRRRYSRSRSRSPSPP